MATRSLVRFALVLIGPNAEFEGSFGYLNHFEPGNSPNPLNLNTVGTIGQPSVMGFLYDVNGVWNFGQRQFLNARISPYLVAGGGGLTAEVRHGTVAFLQNGGMVPDANGNLVPNPGPTKTIHDGDTFFTVNYGGGIKAMNLWGPLGLRADIRGRTIPNFYHSTPTWPEVTRRFALQLGPTLKHQNRHPKGDRKQLSDLSPVLFRFYATWRTSPLEGLCPMTAR
jgi:hypothetical protein